MNRLKYGAGHCTVSLSVIFATVSYSPIVVAGPVHPLVCLPYGYERADINILRLDHRRGSLRLVGPCLCELTVASAKVDGATSPSIRSFFGGCRHSLRT